YFGHGAGETIAPSKRLLRLPHTPSVAFLMGCSSGKLSAPGDFDPMGTALTYLGGSTCVVGNLWDVTDRDIDRFALSALGRWGLVAPSFNDDDDQEAVSNQVAPDLAAAVASARGDCKFAYLIGAAPVVYGV
ncbi:peptidase family C50-domain-containing protein, partial [Blastocladiella britannica]